MIKGVRVKRMKEILAQLHDEHVLFANEASNLGVLQTSPDSHGHLQARQIGWIDFKEAVFESVPEEHQPTVKADRDFIFVKEN